MIRLDFGGRAARAARPVRVAPERRPGIALLARLGPCLPFRGDSVDEVFLDDRLAHVDDFAGTLEELWRACKPGALIHLRLPHASSAWAATGDPRHAGRYTLETFNYFDPRFKRADCPTPATFHVERCRLHVTGQRDQARGLALARGPLVTAIERLANQDRGMQYRWERWLAGLIGGFEEMTVVLSAVK